MKGLRYVIGFCVILFALVMGLHSVSKSDELAKKDVFISSSNVADAFAKEGITLYPSSDFSAEKYTIDGAKPAIYSFEGTKERLFVYAFPAIDARDQAITAIYNGKSVGTGFAELQEAEKYLLTPLQAKNLLMLYTIEYDPSAASSITSAADMKKFQQTYAPNSENVKDVVFKHLNSGVTEYYYGIGKNWAGKVVLQYYEYSWTDENGVERSEGWHQEDIKVKYLGSDPAAVKSLDCMYEGPGGGGRGEFDFDSSIVDKDGYVDLGSNNGEGILEKERKYSMTIGWNGLQETFDITK